jgi:alpha-ribazole phosphatase
MNHQRLYLIRHGEVEQASEARLIGRTDTPLSAHGIDQSHQLAEVLATKNLSAIYSSDLKRTRDTAEIIATRTCLTPDINPDWREIDMGQWEGLTMKRIYDESPDLVAQLFADPSSFQYPGGESFTAFTARIQIALTNLLTKTPNGNVALVTHGGVCRVIVGTVLDLPSRNWLRLAQDYGCLNLIDWYDGNPLLRLLNGLTPIEM